MNVSIIFLWVAFFAVSPTMAERETLQSWAALCQVTDPEAYFNVSKDRLHRRITALCFTIKPPEPPEKPPPKIPT